LSALLPRRDLLSLAHGFATTPDSNGRILLSGGYSTGSTPTLSREPGHMAEGFTETRRPRSDWPQPAANTTLPV